MSRRDFSTRPQRTRSRDAGALLAAGVLAVVSVAFLAQRASGTESRERAALAQARAELAELSRRAAALEARVADADARAAGQLRLNAAAPPGRVLAELAALMPPGVRLDALSLSYGAELRLRLQLQARETGAYDLFLERAAASPALTDLYPEAEVRDDGAVRGGLSAAWNEVTP